MTDRYERQMRFFGKDGQELLRNTEVSVVGAGGTGCHVIQQLSLLGVGKITIIDSEELADTDKNRNVFAQIGDPIPGTKKVKIAERSVKSVNSEVKIKTIHDTFVSAEAFEAIKSSSHVFGCLDSEGGRLILNELCNAYNLKYLDLASDIPPESPLNFGGRVCVNWDGDACLYCLQLIDLQEAQEDLSTDAEREDRKRIYGVKETLLDRTGPSVVSLNGIISSLAINEFIMGVTGMRNPKRLLIYHGERSIVTNSTDEPNPNCYYCKGIRNKGKEADVERYIHNEIGKYLL